MQEPSWKLRRRAVFSSLIFGFTLIAYVALFGESNSLNETLALGAFGLVGAVIAAYIGGAAYEDVKLWKPMSLHDRQNSMSYDNYSGGRYDDYPDDMYEDFDDMQEDYYDDTIDGNERKYDVH